MWSGWLVAGGVKEYTYKMDRADGLATTRYQASDIDTDNIPSNAPRSSFVFFFFFRAPPPSIACMSHYQLDGRAVGVEETPSSFAHPPKASEFEYFCTPLSTYAWDNAFQWMRWRWSVLFLSRIFIYSSNADGGREAKLKIQLLFIWCNKRRRKIPHYSPFNWPLFLFLFAVPSSVPTDHHHHHYQPTWQYCKQKVLQAGRLYRRVLQFFRLVSRALITPLPQLF